MAILAVSTDGMTLRLHWTHYSIYPQGYTYPSSGTQRRAGTGAWSSSGLLLPSSPAGVFVEHRSPTPSCVMRPGRTIQASNLRGSATLRSNPNREPEPEEKGLNWLEAVMNLPRNGLLVRKTGGRRRTELTEESSSQCGFSAEFITRSSDRMLAFGVRLDLLFILQCRAFFVYL